MLPLNAVLHACSGLCLVLIGRHLFSGNFARVGSLVAGYLYVVFPSSLNWYGQNHKDEYAALGFLSLAGERLSFEQVSALLRSPFIAGARSEADARAQLDWSLRRHAEPQLSLDELATLLQRADLPAAPWLQRLIVAYARFRRVRLKGTQLPSAWVQVFNEVLTSLGFPGEEALSSAQFQASQKWQALNSTRTIRRRRLTRQS